MRVGQFHARVTGGHEKAASVDGFVHSLSNALARRGHDVMVAAFNPERPSDAEYEYVPLSTERWGKTTLRRTFVAPWLLHRLNGLGLDVLHLHGDDWFYWRRSVPTMRTFYGSAYSEAMHATTARAKAVFGITFPLEIMSGLLADSRWGIGPDSLALYGSDGVLPISTRLPEFEGARDSEPTVLCVGTWDGRKCARAVHAAFIDHVAPRIPNARLLLVTDKCPEPAHGQVEVIHSPSDRDLAMLYARSWVFCSASRYEGFGLPYLEAMRTGTPVVARTNPGSLHVLGSGAFGLLANSDSELAEQIVRVLTDGAIRARFSAAGRERAEAFTWEAVAVAHEKAYERLYSRDRSL